MKFLRFRFVAYSFSLLVSIYLSNKAITLGKLYTNLGFTCKVPDLPNYVSYFVYFIIPLILTYLTILRLRKSKSYDCISETCIEEIKPSGDFVLPTALGYIFVGLSITNMTTLIIVYILLVILCFSAQIYFLNPIFLIYGYKFYFIKVQDRTFFLISKKDLSQGEKCSFPQLVRINNFTLFDKK